MSKELEAIQQAIRDDIDLTGRVVLAHWIAEYPEYEADLLAFMRSLDASVRSSPDEPVGWPDGGAMVRRLISESTAQFVETRREGRLGERRPLLISRAREVPSAVLRPRLYAELVSQFSGLAKDPTDLVKLAKAAHIAVRYFGFAGFSFVPAPKGPLDEGFYRALGVARRERWIAAVGAYQLKPGARHSEVEREIHSYLRDPALLHQLVRELAPYSGWELGVWSTVLWTGEKLLQRGERVELESLKSGILEEPEWKAGKLDWQEYSDSRILNALEHLYGLGLLRASPAGGD